MSEDRGLSVPNQPQRLPGLPESSAIVSFEQFAGLNTKDPRIAIQSGECSWLDGFMPITDKQLRTLAGPSAPIYTAVGKTIEFFTQFNIGDNYYFFVLFSDGSSSQVRISDGAETGITSAGGLPVTTIMGSASWGGQYFLFSTTQTNGYYIWDGTNLYESGTIGPVITITNGGFNYTTSPTVTLFGGSGSGATFNAQIQNGAVSQILVTNPGSGYSLGNQPIVLFNGGNGTRTAYGLAGLSDGVITNVTLTNGGQNYQNSSGVQQPPTITVTDGTGTGAIISVTQMGGGQVISLMVSAGGTGYTNPTITFTSGTGSGAAAFATVQSGVVTGMSTSDAGLGYVGTTSIDFISETGTGAAAVAALDSTGAISSTHLTQGGNGYSSPTVWIAQGPGPAAATVELMPFGINGTAMETFQSRVWIANGGATSNQSRVVFSAADDPADFNPADGAGAFHSNDSFLRVGYHALKQTNGFLYLIGDSSENTLSGVQTSSPSSSAATSQVVTTFNNQNSDPQFGIAWPSSLQVFSRNIVFANQFGIMISYGGAVTKISQALDGFYGVELSSAADTNYSSAVANLFGNLVYMLLIPVLDPITATIGNKLVMWDGKKFWVSSAPTLTYIATVEENSIMSSWGTDGAHIFEMFTTASNTITKRLQTRLWVDPSYWATKTAIRLSGVIQANNADEPINITIDSETGSTSAYTPTLSGTPSVFGPIPIGQNGRCLGMTLTTNASDIIILSLSLETQIFTSNV